MLRLLAQARLARPSQGIITQRSIQTCAALRAEESKSTTRRRRKAAGESTTEIGESKSTVRRRPAAKKADAEAAAKKADAEAAAKKADEAAAKQAANVPSDPVLSYKVPEGEYKQMQYHEFNKDSHADFEVAMRKYRLPQPEPPTQKRFVI
eukprot:Clim_evm27s221 gene=Clim_evmTU27s221